MHIIPDKLHLMLGVTDVLIEAAIDIVTSYDQYQHELSGYYHNALNKLDGTML